MYGKQIFNEVEDNFHLCDLLTRYFHWCDLLTRYGTTEND